MTRDITCHAWNAQVEGLQAERTPAGADLDYVQREIRNLLKQVHQRELRIIGLEAQIAHLTRQPTAEEPWHSRAPAAVIAELSRLWADRDNRLECRILDRQPYRLAGPGAACPGCHRPLKGKHVRFCALEGLVGKFPVCDDCEKKASVVLSVPTIAPAGKQPSSDPALRQRVGELEANADGQDQIRRARAVLERLRSAAAPADWAEEQSPPKPEAWDQMGILEKVKALADRYPPLAAEINRHEGQTFEDRVRNWARAGMSPEDREWWDNSVEMMGRLGAASRRRADEIVLKILARPPTGAEPYPLDFYGGPIGFQTDDLITAGDMVYWDHDQDKIIGPPPWAVCQKCGRRRSANLYAHTGDPKHWPRCCGCRLALPAEAIPDWTPSRADLRTAADDARQLSARILRQEHQASAQAARIAEMSERNAEQARTINRLQQQIVDQQNVDAQTDQVSEIEPDIDNGKAAG